MDLLIDNLFDINHSLAKDYLNKFKYPWEALKGLKDEIIKIGNSLDKNEYEEIKKEVWVHKTATIFQSAYISSPAIIGENTEIRQAAFIRGSVIVGNNCVIGNSCELKNAIVMDNAQIPHFNYVGDSIIGYKAHMGAGSITSNVKSDKTNVVIHNEGIDIETNLKKVGAFLADYVEVGCNSVLNPGTVIGRNSNVYPLSSVRGVIDKDSIYKQNKVVKKR